MQHSGTALYGFILCCARGLSPLVYAVYSKCTSGYSENIRIALYFVYKHYFGVDNG